MIEAYPLCWPEGYKRTQNPVYSRFGSRNGKASLYQMRQTLKYEIHKLGGTGLIISTNMKTRNDGEVQSNAKEPDDPGVAVYFTIKGKQRCFACDQYRRVWENIYAISKTINALRGIDRWGVSDLMERIFTGFIAIPDDAGKSWRSILGISDDATLQEIKKAYRLKAKELHPDIKKDDYEAFLKLDAAYDQAIKEKSNER